MKILYIGMKYDYGDSKRGFSFEHYNFYESLVAMDGGRHEIVYFPFDEVMCEVGQEAMNKQLIETSLREKPDLCFFFLFTDEITKETIKTVTEKSGATTFNWFADDHWRFDNFSKFYASYFNYISTTDSKAPEKYRKMKYENVIKSQWACNVRTYRPFVDARLRYDVTFVGQPHSDRRGVAERIRGADIDLQCWGNGWPNRRVSQEEMIRIFSESRINSNLTKGSGAVDIKQLAKIFLGRRTDGSYQLQTPPMWINNARSLWNKRREQIKGRNFEIPGCGGFLLTADADNLRDYYIDGKEIVIFKDVPDLIEKARYYLAHEDERVAIAKAGYERTIREHTYEKRFQELFRIMGLYN
ncbi:glycosyltransferase [Candidatus Dependentiae bacterium]|nr:glycosyltransferase [Candidatus Dependentiae bacterium]